MSCRRAGHKAWHHGRGGGIGHSVVYSVRGAVYDVLWKAMRGPGLAGSAVTAASVIALMWAVT